MEVGFVDRFDELYAVGYRAGYAVLGRRADAEDCAQEAMARALARWERVQVYAPAWVARVATNLALDRARRLNRRRLDPAVGVLDDPVAIRRHDLVSALRALPKRQREAVVLRYLVDLSEVQTAQAMGCATGTERRRPRSRSPAPSARADVGIGGAMNFDDLHDPDPPRPGTAALAAVAGRARQIRRRRTALVAAGGVLVAAAVVVPTALVVTGDDTSDRMVPATVPPAPETTTAPTPTTAVAPSTTVTTVAPVARLTVLAVRADGDAVRIEPDGAETVLYDEFDVSDPSVEGGDSVGVDSMAVTADGRQFVALCCEPIVGSWFEVGAEDAVRYGTHLDVSPDGTRLVAAGGSFVAVYAPDGTPLADTDVSANPISTQLEEAMWLDDDTLVLLALQDGPTFRLLTVDAALGAIDPTAGVVIPALPSPDAASPELAGVGDDGSILVVQRAGGGMEYAAATMLAYDPVTLERRPGSDVTIPEPAIFSWFEDGVLTWIGEDYSLHVGDTVVPGEYLWARPV